MKKTILQESEQGIVYRIEKIPSDMFDFYIMKGRAFKNGTHAYKLCVSLSSNPNKCLTLATIRGRKSDAIRSLENIVKHGGRMIT